MPLSVLRKLEAKQQGLNFREEAKDAPHVLERCESLEAMFMEMKGELELMLPTVLLLKGMVKGFQLALPMVEQHKKIFNQKAKAEEITKEEFWEKAEVIDACASSVREATDKQREELLRSVGRFDGVAHSAEMVLNKIQMSLNNLQSQQRMMETNPDLFEDVGEDKPPTDNVTVINTKIKRKKKKASGKK